MNPPESTRFSEGRIHVRLGLAPGQANTVVIRSSRPQLARPLMLGRTPEEAERLAGQVFSLCGQAQARAAGSACHAALGLAPETTAPLPVAMELAREHVWRLLLDWPQEAGEAPDMASLLALRRAPPEHFAATLESLLAHTLLGEAPATWLARDLDGLDHWCRQAGTLPARLFGRLLSQLPDSTDPGAGPLPLLPPLAHWQDALATHLAQRALDDPDYCALPDWQGAPAETGAIARVQDHPLLAAWIEQRGRGLGARQLARLVELAGLPGRLGPAAPALVRSWTLAAGVGLAGVETSRGLLLHVARLDQGRVADYRILAPTEWNFHPAGPLCQALQHLPAGPDLPALARQAIRALDPCVAFDLEIHDA